MDPRFPQPESPPQLKRKWTFHRTQAIGIPLLAVLPLLAALGSLGPSAETHRIQDADVRLEVTAPSRMRYKTVERLRIRVVNVGDGTISPKLMLKHEYLEAFTKVVSHPHPNAIRNGFVTYELGPVPRWDTAEVVIQLEAERYGRVQGHAHVKDGPEMRFETLVIP